jgi:uncharacterized phage protein gp47/JayE
MPYPRPTLTTLRAQAMQDITTSGLPGADGTMRNSVLRVIAWVLAGFAHLHFGYQDYISLQSVPFTATAEFLEGWAALKKVLRKAATPTQGNATFSAPTGPGPIPTLLTVLGNTGLVYNVTSVTVNATTIVVYFTCATPGSVGNFDTNALFSLGSSIAGVVNASMASAQTTVGTDTELDPALQARMLTAYAMPPQGGSNNDYIEWATAVPGVTRAWVAPALAGPGTVSVFTMFDIAEADFGGFPQGTNGVASNETRGVAATGDQLTVANELFPQRPTTALVYSLAPTASPVAFTVADLGANNTPAILADITTALTDMFLRLGNVGGTLNPASGAAWPAIEPDDWYAALEAIPGLAGGFKVTVPTAAITPATGALFTVGTVTPVS